MVFCSEVNCTPGAVLISVVSMLSSPVDAILNDCAKDRNGVCDTRMNELDAVRMDGVDNDLISK